jgi:hypothetical protein
MVNDPFHTQEFLFHRATIDRIDYFLGKGKISCKKGGRGISFTEGIPILPGHGDSAIVFRREWLDNQSCESKKIDYSDHNMIEEYRVLGHPSKGRQEFIDRLTDEKKLREALGNLDLESKTFLENQIERIKNSSDEEIQQVLLQQYSSWENEVIALSDELTFEKCDIAAIIPFYRFYMNHFESLEEYKENLIFIDDLFRYGEEIIVKGQSHPRSAGISIKHNMLTLGKEIRLVNECDIRLQEAYRLLGEFKNQGAQQIGPLMMMNTTAFHIACSLIGDQDDYESIQEIFPEHKFPIPPDFLTDLLSRLYLLPNDQFKSNFIDHLSSRLRLSEPELSLTDNFYISEIENRLD